MRTLTPRTYDVLLANSPIDGVRCDSWQAIADLIHERTGFLRNELFREMKSSDIYFVRYRDVRFNSGQDILVAVVLDHTQNACPGCSGTGKYRGPTGHISRCFRCNGTGTPIVFYDEIKPIAANAKKSVA